MNNKDNHKVKYDRPGECSPEKDNLSGSHLQSQMTSAQVVETSVNVISNSPSQDYTHPDDRTLLYDMTPGFKPFTIKIIAFVIIIIFSPLSVKVH